MKQALTYIVGCISLLTACQPEIPHEAEPGEVGLFPDYQEVTVPVNIAPLNFKLQEQADDARAIFASEEQQFVVKGKNGSFEIPASKWQDLLQSAVGKSLQVTIQVKRGTEWTEYAPFPIQVVSDKIDAYMNCGTGWGFISGIWKATRKRLFWKIR